jgi:hypothetical protein
MLYNYRQKERRSDWEHPEGQHKVWIRIFRFKPKFQKSQYLERQFIEL